MAKILVVYDSNSGNTEKMALAVAKGAEQARRFGSYGKKSCRNKTE